MRMRNFRKVVLTLAVCMVYGILPPQASALALTISYSYDAAGQLTQAQYSNSQYAAFAYDDAGNIVNHIVAGAANAVSPVMLLLQERAKTAAGMSIAEH